MSVGLTTAALICFILGVLHAAIGLRGVLPSLTKDRFPSTRFGPASLTAGMVRFTWHMVTLILFGFAALLTTLAFADDARSLVLGWVAVLFFTATVVAFHVARWRLRAVIRFPFALFTAVIAVLCWIASA
jgi:hypothetical protein